MEPGQPDTLREAFARFADEVSAHRYLEGLLWPDGMRCPHCGDNSRIGRLNGASTRIGTFKCYACRKCFGVTHGTLLSSSHVPAHKWLQAIYLTDGGTKQMRPHHLQQILNVSFKTASAMMRRLSKAAGEADDGEATSSGKNAGGRQVAKPGGNPAGGPVRGALRRPPNGRDVGRTSGRTSP